jgi:hypothetical protein
LERNISNSGLGGPFRSYKPDCVGCYDKHAGNVFGSEATKLANATGGVGGAAKQTFFSSYVPTAAIPPAAAPIAKTGVPDGAMVNSQGQVIDAAGNVIDAAPVADGVTKSIVDTGPVVPDAPKNEPGFLEKTGDYMFRGGKTEAEVLLAQQKGGNAARALGVSQGITDDAMLSSLAAKGAKAAGPGMLARYGPTAALAGIGAAGAGFFDCA